MPALESLAAERGLGLLEDACQALGAVDSEGAWGHARQRGGVRLLRQQAADDGGGRDAGPPTPTPRSRCAASETRAARRHGWVEHDRLGFNYRLTDVAAALGVAQLERLDEHARRACRAARLRERLAELDWSALAGSTVPRSLELPCPARAPSAELVRLRRAAPRGNRPRSRDRLPSRRRHRRKAYLPCIHLFPSIRERFGLPAASSRSRSGPRSDRWRFPSSRR